VAFKHQNAHNTAMNSQALLRRAFTGDTTLQDVFIVAVRTTGIYCRPSCNPPRKPKLENRIFFSTPLEASSAGFRPCKLCRPNTIAPLDVEKSAVNALIHNAKRDPAMFENVEAMAAAANMSLSKLYKLFKQHRGVTPAEILARVRIEAACKHLETSQTSISTIALEVGFQSLSAFNANFRRLMQSSPLEYRRLRTAICSTAEAA
jgi:methylphosphotriester-DNA--protein-cysteine methyltransferase